MATRKWHVLVFLASVALWAIVYALSSIHDASLYAICEAAKLGAIITSFAFVATVGLELSGAGKKPSPAGKDSKRDNRQLSRADTIVGSVSLLALLGYSPAARYFQVLTPVVFWAVVIALAAIGALLINLWSIRSGRPPNAEGSIRIDRGLLPGLLLVPCLAIVLRLVDTVPAILSEPTTHSGTVVDTSIWGGLHAWASYSVEVRIDSGQTVSFNVSRANFEKLPIGTKIKLQAWDGLLGMPCCLGDCMAPATTVSQ